MPAMKALLGTLWLALACGSVHTTLSKSDAKKAASKTLPEKVRAVWGLAKGLTRRTSFCLLGPCTHAAGEPGSQGAWLLGWPALCYPSALTGWPQGAASGA